MREHCRALCNRSSVMSKLIYLCVPAWCNVVSCFCCCSCRSRTREIGIAKRVYIFASLIGLKHLTRIHKMWDTSRLFQSAHRVQLDEHFDIRVKPRQESSALGATHPSRGALITHLPFYRSSANTGCVNKIHASKCRLLPIPLKSPEHCDRQLNFGNLISLRSCLPACSIGSYSSCHWRTQDIALANRSYIFGS